MSLTPPSSQILLLGPSELVLEVYDPYVERGASAVDARDGAMAARVVSPPPDTAAVTQPGKPQQVSA